MSQQLPLKSITDYKPKRTRGKHGHAPVQGRLYYVQETTRMVRTWDMAMLPIPHGWKQVTLAEWEAFRAETKQKYTTAQLMKLRRDYKAASSAS